MSNVTLETVKGKYFFSGTININPGSVLEVDPSVLTKTQLEDIYQSFCEQDLLVDDIDDITCMIDGNCSSGGNDGSDEDDLDLGEEIENLDGETIGYLVNPEEDEENQENP